MNVDRSLRLSAGQYFAEPVGAPAVAKSLIVLHHTVGGSAASTVKWWEEDPRRVGTAYIVARDGTVHEVFPPECWAHHLKVGSLEAEQRSIGIELASEGALTEARGIVYAFDDKKYLGRSSELLAAGRVIRLVKVWRGYQWFDAYDEAQVVAVIALVVELCARFGIPTVLPRQAAEGTADVRRWVTLQGVAHHAMLREDKTDLNPTFNFARLAQALHAPGW